MPPADPARPTSAMLDAAALWVARTRGPSFGDWEAFTAWLEADSAHNAAYEAALDAHDAAEGLAAPILPIAEPVADAPVPPRRIAWRRWLGAAAAGIAVAVSLPLLMPHDRYEVATAAGEQRTLHLADGTQLALNGDSRVSLDRADPRSIRLERGEAGFAVVHDARHPFVVTAGDSRIEDVGTVFTVARRDGATEVAVAEGAVVYDPDGARVKLDAGRSLRDPDGGMIEVSDVDPQSVGAWRAGRLVYRGVPLSTVARDLSQVTGRSVTVAPDIAARSFSGTIQFRGVPADRLFGRVAALTGTRAVHGGGGWQLSGEAGAAR